MGVDVVEVDRVARLVEKFPRAEDRLFTEGEQEYCRSRRRCYEHMAARFAAKEAVRKCLGTGLAQQVRWRDVEIVRTESGKPRVELSGEAAAHARRIGITSVEISLSHTASLALAQAVAISG